MNVMEQQGSYRYKTQKELTEEDDCKNYQADFVFIPDNSLFCKFNDNDYPYVSNTIHAINKLYQSKLDLPITNEEKVSNKTYENTSNKTDENNKLHKKKILHRFHKRNLQDKREIRKDQEDFNILSIDIRVPIIGMNSIREFGSFSDIEYEYSILSELFSNYSKHVVPL